ncbi:DoxX family membrane protein [Litoribacter ruber]|uniref:TQO small subunit DoxD n=1 Tax=Litoribacter ruber TaxID=702568 RepID=UPI001BDB30CF|nr:TQO small subunit DoxD [Litoribacter ruber]MBT0810045.1 DoxX family membrane protein [Litoribacter ruber]
MKSQELKSYDGHSYELAGLFSLALRLVAGWTYFSAFWRRLVLENKLDPDAPGYIGEKFNHFLPNALGIQPMIEYLLLNPDILWIAMTVFTLVEAVVGLLFMLGLFTRLMSVGVFGLAMGILLGAGWIGTTCLDEWQIGILGIAVGFTVFLSGSGRYSLDYYLMKNHPSINEKPWFSWLASGVMPIKANVLHKLVLGGSLAILFITLLTNQVFHGGVWGTLHNKSVKPKLELSKPQLENGSLEFTVFRVEGVDVYGSWLIGIALEEPNGEAVLELDGKELAAFPESQIANTYVTKVKPGAHSLIIPLGGKARLRIEDTSLTSLNKNEYRLRLTDISGAEWTIPVYK